MRGEVEERRERVWRKEKTEEEGIRKRNGNGKRKEKAEEPGR